jgi:hypothetical protein
MAEVTSTLTFQDLILRVAETAGMCFYGSSGQRPAMIPIDYHDLDKCKRIVNDAIRMFISRGPANGWNWRRRIATVTFPKQVVGEADGGSAITLTDALRTEAADYFNTWTLYIYEGTGIGEYATVTDYAPGTITFAALSGSSTPDATSKYKLISDITNVVNFDVSRIYLPEDFGGAANGPITYSENSPYASQISWTGESEIRQLRSSVIITGYPTLAAVRPCMPTSVLGSNRRWEIIVDPVPVEEMTLIFPYTSMFDQLRLESGMATGGSGSTLVDTNRTETTDYFKNWTLYVIDGVGAGESATVTGYNATTKTFAFTALSGGSTPNTTSAYVVVPVERVHPAGAMFDQTIVDACMCQLEMQIKDTLSGALEYFEKISLPAAYKTDYQSAPRSVGNLNSGSYHQSEIHNWIRVKNASEF